MIHPELNNLAENLDEDTLTEIAETVIEEFENDLESRRQWEQMHAHWLNLYYQQDKPVNGPWDGSSDESVPLLVEACNQFQARAYKAFFPNRKIVKAIPAGKTDEKAEERADRVSKHLSYQLVDKDRTYKEDKDSLLLSLPLHGSFFTKAYHDPVKNRSLVRNVRAEDLVVPYGRGPRRLEDLERKTEIIWCSVNKTRIYAKNGFFIDEAEIFEGSDDSETKKATDEAEGLQESSKEKGNCKILEQHRLWDLDGDGIAEPYIMTVDAQSRKTLRVAVRYELDDQGNPTNDKEPYEYYTHYSFLKNPDGFYGLGMGHLIGKINTAVNKLLRQTVDAGTLATIGNMSGYLSGTLGIPKGEVELVLGKFATLENSGEDINKGIFQFRFPEPSQTLTGAIEFLVARADRLATVTEAVSGQMDTVQQPTAILALIEQALELFTSVYERLFTSWESELNKIYRLNGRFLDDEYYPLLDLHGDVEGQGEIQKSDYANDLQIIPRADPKMSTEKLKLTRAQAEYEAGLNNPLIANNPNTLYSLTRRYLEAIGSERVDEILMPPQEQEPERVDDPMIENGGALLPNPSVPPVHADQNHLLHLKAHEAFINDPQYANRMTPDGKQAIMDHIQTHTAFLYWMTETNYGEMMDGPAQAGSMAGGPGNAMVPGQPQGEIPAAMGADGLMGPGEQA